MNTTEMLLIRACKSIDSQTRIGSVLRRFYLVENASHELGLTVSVLSEICDKYQLISVYDIIQKLSPMYMRFPLSGEKVGYSERCRKTLISTIRHTSKDKLPGLISPRRCR
jgi:hypothetical protein